MELRFRCMSLLVVVLVLFAADGLGRSALPGTPAGFSFSGDWDCSGTFPGNGKSHRSTYHGEQSADGRWTDLIETDIDPKGYVGHYSITSDEGGTKTVLIDTNNAGYAIFGGSAWQGNRLMVTTDVVHYTSPIAKNRFIYTALDSRHFDVEWQVEKGTQWLSGDLLHCAKKDVLKSADYFTPDVLPGQTYNTVFSRTISFKGDAIDEFVRRAAGTASTTVTKVGKDEIDSDDVWRYDGIQEGHASSERKDSGRTACSNGKCSTATDASGTFYNALFWGRPPDTIQAGMTWVVHIDIPWELGPAGDQTVTVLLVDPTSGTVILKREGSGAGGYAGDLKQIPVVRSGKTYKVDVTPGPSHWIGQTILRRGVVLSDELLVERPVTLSSTDFGTVSANERQFILLNAAP